MSMALESEPVFGVGGLPQIHPRQRNKTKYHTKSGHQKQCAARCLRWAKEMCVFRWKVEAYGHVTSVT